MTDLIKLTVDGKEIEVPRGTSVLQACELADVQVPRFCYHSRLSIAGNCRMCLVEIEGAPKPVASCAFPAGEGQVIRTQSQIAKDARKSVMEFLLANHPLDCPLCDQGGECDLQDFSMGCGQDKGSFNQEKRLVENPDLGPYIQTFMNRCIHCMRCTRFSDEIAGKNELAGIFRGEGKSITNSDQGEITSNLSGNMIDLCPVGALTSKPYKYSARSWELTKNKTIDVLDSILPSVYIDTKNNKVMRIRGRENDAINQEWISDQTRFSYDGLYNNRIQNCQIKGQNSTWDEAFNAVLDKLQNANPSHVAGLVGDNLAIEDIYSFKQLLTKTVGSKNIDFRHNGFSLKSFNKSNVTFSSSIKDIDNADSILFIGTDLEKQSPVLNSRIFQQTRVRDLDIYNIGSELENYQYNIKNLSKNINTLVEDPKAVTSIFKNSKNGFIFVDVETILTRTDADAIIKHIDSIVKDLNVTVNYYSRSSGFINAVDVDCSPLKGGLSYKKVLKEIENETLEVLFVYSAQNINLELLEKAKFVIYAGTHNNEISKLADIVLPTTTFTEKNSLWNNVEGKVLESKASTLPYKDSKVDWKIWRALSEYLGESLEFNSLDELRNEISKLNNIDLDEKVPAVISNNKTVINAKSITKIKVDFIKTQNEISQNSVFYK